MVSMSQDLTLQYLTHLTLCSRHIKQYTDVKKVLLYAHHLVWNSGKALPHTTLA
jgi:hypothetical protein